MAHQHKIEMVALDMDGTTYAPGGAVVPENVQPIHHAIANHVKVVFVTGRSVVSQLNNIKENGFASHESLVVGTNGAVIYDFEKEQALEMYPMKKEIAEEVFRLAQQIPEAKIGMWAYLTNLNEAVSYGELALHEGDYFNGHVSKWIDHPHFDQDVLKIMIFNCPKEIWALLKKHHLNISGKQSSYAIEVNAPGINKAFALEQVAKRWHIDLKNVMAMGDGHNDIEMMEIVGFPIAFKNSIEEIKTKTDYYINKDWSEGVVGYAINKYILGK